jgi:predicted RNA-binding Zn-ribbon protein involved in translation (DUF1610 family)
MDRSNSQKQLRFSSPRAVARAKLATGLRRGRRLPHLFEDDKPERRIHRCSQCLSKLRVRRVSLSCPSCGALYDRATLQMRRAPVR